MAVSLSSTTAVNVVAAFKVKFNTADAGLADLGDKCHAISLASIGVARFRDRYVNRSAFCFYDPSMTPMISWPRAFAELGRTALNWLAGWWQIIHLGALLLVLALSPSSYARRHRASMAHQIYQGTAPTLLWFTLLIAIISLVLTRIVVVTALGYGLTQYALEMIVRVLVLELIPITAAMFAALNCTIPDAAEIAALRAGGQLDAARARGLDPLQHEVLPRVVAGVVAVAMLATVSCLVALIIAYLVVYGFTLEGFAAYTRTVGHVFNPAVTLIFALKTFFLGLAVSLVPVASVLHDRPSARSRASAEMQGLVRLFVVILLIEAVSLVGNYY